MNDRPSQPDLFQKGTNARQLDFNVVDEGFNPGGNITVGNIRQQAARMQRVIESQVEPSRRRSIALTKLEEAAMWAVKAATAGDD